jgi:hypothetical protein
MRPVYLELTWFSCIERWKLRNDGLCVKKTLKADIARSRMR